MQKILVHDFSWTFSWFYSKLSHWAFISLFLERDPVRQQCTVGLVIVYTLFKYYSKYTTIRVTDILILMNSFLFWLLFMFACVNISV